MGINYWGVVHGTQLFLPHLKASGDGHVVNISSVFGLIAVPRQAAYHSAKFAVRGFTECLRQEMNETRSRFPGSKLHLRFNVKPDPPASLAFPGRRRAKTAPVDAP